MSPLEEYRARIEDRRRASESLEQRSRRIGNARLAAGLAAVALAFLVFGEVWISVWWLLLPVAAFGALVVRHARVAERLERSQRAIQFYERGVARLEDRWRGTAEWGETGERFRNPGHVYAEDLDLFGKSSLFQLLSTARTRAGEDFLAKWLLAPAAQDEVAARHSAVQELGGMLDLREDLAVLGATVRSGLDPDASARWGEAPEVRFPAGARSIALAFGAAILISFALYMAGVTTRTPFLAILFLEMGYAFFLNAQTSRVTQAVESPSHDLVLLAELLQRLEQETFHAPLLQQLHARLKAGSEPNASSPNASSPNASSPNASSKIAHLGRLGERLDWAENKVFGPVAFALLWTAQVAMAIERWRRASGRHIREWIDVVGEFEALCSLAGYAYEHPADVFPELVDVASGCFEAQALGHPLMKEAHSIRNDVHLGEETRLWIVSGSNMSGKSTLLRTIGINTVLAWAGAPVRATRLRISPLSLGASIRVQDSLEDGRSRFYAEITRLREIVALTKGPRTVLFLLDELLSGTNSHDRQIGAAAIVHALIDRGALGLITTHDLALAHIADNLSGRAVNIHFADTLQNGELHFDYRLQPGVVERSNALDLMRSVGLEV